MAISMTSAAAWHATSRLKRTPRITVTNMDRNYNGTMAAAVAAPTATSVGGGGVVKAVTSAVQPKSPDSLTALMAKKSITSMSDEEIIQENLKEILDLKSREERKANGRLVAVIVASLVIFLAIYHAWIQNLGAMAGVLVPAGIMLSYGLWVVVLAKRDKHKRAMFERHIEEVALKNKCELEDKHTRLRHSSPEADASASSSLHYVNELLPMPKKQKHRRHRQRQRQRDLAGTGHGHGNGTDASSSEVTVHRSGKNGPKRPSFRQKLFGQTIAHVKLVEMQGDSIDSNSTTDTNLDPAEKRKRLQRMDTMLPMPQVVRMSSAP
ncbi:LOW QUALITY PROTEIN: uncharacterized protein [Drosophila tropicalis]|uniref:LOW QUALITY PROTEIN: uncharacterized protein n=1 Tax=Drosophila tropicalis TaxID=46794 RepID=UPI0035AB8352